MTGEESKKEQEKFEKYQKALKMVYAEDQEKFEEYQKALKMAYADGVVSFAERNKLIALKNELGLSDRDCKNMEYAYRLISEKADSMDKSTEQLHADNGINDAAGKTISDRTLSVSNYGVYFFAGGKEVSFLGFEYTAAGEEAVLDMLGIKELRNGRGLKLEYRLDGEGKEQFLASDRPENIFDAQVFVDGDYRSERPGRNRTFPEKIKDDMRRAAEEYTRENFGKSVREQIQAENEMNAALTAIDAYCDNGIVPNDGRFILLKTPEYLRRIGSDETEITLPVSVVKKAMERHHLTKDEIKSAVCGLYDPVLAFDSDRSRTENKADSRLILTDEFKDGKPIALAVNVNSTIRVSNGKKSLEVQNIRTIHDRTLTAKNGTDLIQKWTEDGLCRYVDDKKITGWSNVARVYFPIDELQSADNRIVRKSDIVNSWNDFFRNGEEIKIPNEVSEDMKNTVKASELINEVEGYTGHTKEIYEGLINYAYHRSAIQESGRESTDDFQMLFQNYVANRIPNEIARNGLIEKIKSFDGKTVIFDPDGINVGTAGLSDREGEKELKNLLSELKESYPTLVNNLKNQNPIEQKEKVKEYQEWLSMTSPDEKQPHVQERDIAPGDGEEVDKGVEQIQASGGMDSAAMEADYEAEQNPRPDYLDEQGNPHWFDEEEETEVIFDSEIERLKEQNPADDLFEIPLTEITEKSEISASKEPIEIIKAIADEKEQSEVPDLFTLEFKDRMRPFSLPKDPFIVAKLIINEWKESKPEYLPVLNEWLKKQGCTSKEGFDAFFRTINEPEHKKTQHKEISRQHER